MTAPPLRLLSLDGGGIRGLSELIILDDIMDRLKYALKSPVDLLPADDFDMICGTSNGASYQMQCFLGKEIFKNKRSKSVHGYAFESSNMERAVKNLLEVKYGHGHGNDRMLADEEETRHSCKAFVCAVSSSHVEGDPTKFRTWSVAKDRSPNCKIWDAARATCAASRFFQSILIEENGIDEEFVDAGLGCNNPIKQLISEAKSEFAQMRAVACILSIGAGIPKALDFTRLKSLTEKVAPMSLVNVLKGMATSTEKEAAEMENKFANVPGVYDRSNVGRDIGDIGLEELEELGQHYPQSLNTSAFHAPKLIDMASCLDLACMQLTFSKVWGGGSGKTQLALHYCRKAVSQGGFNAVLWIDGTAKTSIDQSFSRIVDSIIRKSLGSVDITSFPVLVRKQIEMWKEPWLLVFDNFDDPANCDITKYLPQRDFGLIINYKTLDPAAPDQEITLTIFTTWELSYNRISGSKEIIETKRHFLLISAYFGGSCIDECVFRQFLETNFERPSWINIFQDQETYEWNNSAFLAVVTELRGLSLFRSNSVLSQGAVYSFHPMTRKWALYRQSRTERQDLALEAMAILVNSNFDMPADKNLVYPSTVTMQHNSLPDPPMGTWCEGRLLRSLALVYQQMARSVPREQRKLYEACTTFLEIENKLLHHIEKFWGEQIWLKRHISKKLYRTLQSLEPKKKCHLETPSFAEKIHL
ncbi:hypothetical protein BOTNAR_0237g00120 [Botryotinia narcissicola]|uniref:PNPLA domain-containing protein n=1 Tax=Botryotinia narcissicola TaxID=278944 RepID=A0A4Z1I3C0_9HELO|nr:hypothetical protein BOTNAR_0237g00120 [Botryotinia narcissicola]